MDRSTNATGARFDDVPQGQVRPENARLKRRWTIGRPQRATDEGKEWIGERLTAPDRGERQFIARTDDDLVAISPDGAWIAARHGERGGLHALVEGHGRGRYVAWRVADGAGPVALPGVPDDATGFGFALWIRYDPAP